MEYVPLMPVFDTSSYHANLLLPGIGHYSIRNQLKSHSLSVPQVPRVCLLFICKPDAMQAHFSSHQQVLAYFPSRNVKLNHNIQNQKIALAIPTFRTVLSPHQDDGKD
jgi:hypothetical protein